MVCDKNSLTQAHEEDNLRTRKTGGKWWGWATGIFLVGKVQVGHRKSDWSLLYITRHSSKLLYTFPWQNTFKRSKTAPQHGMQVGCKSGIQPGLKIFTSVDKQMNKKQHKVIATGILFTFNPNVIWPVK